MLITSHNKTEIEKFKGMMKSESEMKMLGPAKRILEMEIVRDRKNKTLFLSQKSYIKKVLQRFLMENSKVVSTPLAQYFKLSTS